MANFKISKLTIFFFIAAIILALFALRYINNRVPVAIDNNQTSQSTTTTENGGTLSQGGGAATSTPQQPGTLNLPIPFTSQAPTANWDLVHNEDCEEAAAVMANAYLTGNTAVVLPAAQVETEMTNLNNWENQHFGYYLDTTAQETAQMIEAVYGLNATVQTGYSLQDVKDQLNMHHVVIIPVDGQIIGNPNYTAPGPIYHMLVIRGYTSAELITDDSGTRKGQNYPYAFNTLYNAGANWNHNTNTIDRDQHLMIIVSK